jgi:MYXO-CTERM domain-containing protein
MIVTVAFLASTWLAAQCTGAACPNPCTACAFDPVSGSNSDAATIMQTFDTISQRQGAADLPAIDTLETGPARERSDAQFPCRLMPAIGATESSITQFCTESNLTVISFDCGFGIMQVTSGAASYPGIQSREDINIAAGADILAQKWNGNESFGGQFGESDPTIVESWYFAVWAYNGFVYSNNPNNPDNPATRPPFNGPSSLSRGSYPYQELVWGYLHNPEERDGEQMWEPIEVSYPDNVPDQSGLFSVQLALPEPTHTDPCGDDCEDCPPADLRTLFLDDADPAPAFTIVSGDVETHAEGGFREQFRSAAIGDGDVVVRFEGTAPSTGRFDVGAFIPLDPATCEDVRITVRAVGVTTELTQNQNVNGGFFATLGQVILGAGQPVVIEITNASSDADPDHRIGIDAFRLTWRENAELPGEGEGEGEAGEGEGEGEGEGDGRITVPPPPGGGGGGGCACSASTSSDASALALALAALAALGRARARRTAAQARPRLVRAR